MAVELGTGYVSIIPSARGIGNGIEEELGGPIRTAATRAGQDASKNIAQGARSAAGAVESEATNIGSRFGSIGKAAGQAGTEIQSQFKGAGASILGAAAAPAALATAVVGVGAVAAKAVGEFENLGLSVGKLSDSTGLSAEASSRFIEVANDAGVSTDTLARSIGFMQKAAANTPQTFADLGVAIAHTSSGAVDVQQTLLNATDVIKGITDPNQKAAAATKLFGKSWKDMSELINRGSGQLKDDLASVQASKVFSAADVAQARGVRDAFDSIHDAIDGLLLTLGKALAPAIIAIAPKFGELVHAAEPAFKAIGDGFVNLAKQITPLIDSTVQWANTLKDIGNIDINPGGQLGTVGDLWKRVTEGLPGVGQVKALSDQYHELTDVTVKASIGFRDVPAMQAEASRLTAQAAPYLAEQARQQAAVNAETDRYTAMAAQYVATQAAISARLEGLRQRYFDVSDAAGNTDRQVGAFSKTLQQVGADAESSAVAGVGLAEAYSGLTDSVKTNKNAFDINTQAGRDNFKAISDVGDNIRTNLVEQLKNADGNYGQVTKSANLYREQLVAQLRQAGFTEEQIASYIKTLGLTPEQVQTAIELSGQAAAQQAISLLNVSLDEFDDPNARQAYVAAIARGDYETALNIIEKVTNAHDKTVNYAVNTTYREFGNRTPGAKSYSGGPVNVGQGHLVGDGPGGRIGPYTEAFFPTERGTILSSADLRDVLKGGTGRQATTSSGGGFNVGEVHLHSNVDADGFFRMAEFRMMAAA